MKQLQITALLLAAIGAAVSTSCSTTKGFGQDLQKVGNRIENRADATGGAQPDTTTGIYTQPTTPPVPSAY